MTSIIRTVLVLIGLLEIPAGGLLASPANDAFSSATSLDPALPATASGDALGATYQTGEPVVDSSIHNGSIWLGWTPAASGTARPVFTWTADGTGQVNGTSFRMIVHKGTTLAGLTQLAMGTEVVPINSFSFSAGQTYYFQIAVRTDSSAAAFPYSFTLASAPSTPANDLFANATVLASPLPVSTSGTTMAATIEPGETIDSNQSRSVWHKWTPAAAGACSFALTGTDAAARPLLDILTGTSVGTLTRIARIDPGGTTTLTVAAGTIYYLRVLTIDTVGPAGPFSIAITSAGGGTPPANDNFSAATNLGSALDTPASSTTSPATLETNEPTPFFMASTVWFKWTAPSTGWFNVSGNSGNLITPALAVWQGTALTNIKLRSSSDAYDSFTLFAASAGETLYFQAGAQAGHAGDFTLTVSADSDPGIPRVTAISCNPTSVSVATANKSVTATITLAGPPDGVILEVDMVIPGGGLVASLATEDLTQTSGTPGNGTFTASFTVPKRSPAGSYPIIVYLTNTDGTWYGTCAPTSLITSQNPPAVWYNYVDVASGSNFLTVTNTGTQATPPVLTSFSATASVDTTSAAGNVTFTATLTDSQGVVASSILWQDPAGLIPSDATGLTKTSGSATSGTWGGTFAIPAHTAAGRLNLTVMVWNSIGQARSYGYQYGAGGLTDQFDGTLQTLPSGFTSSITIMNTGAADMLPPQVASLTFSPNPATFGPTDQVDVTVTATVADALSGTSGVIIEFPDAPALGPLTLVHGTGNTYSAVMTFNHADFTSGTFAPEVTTTDPVGNYGVFTPVVPGTGSITLLRPGAYEAWIAGYGMTAPDNDPGACPRGDGIANLNKYAFNMDPTQSATGAARILTPSTGTSGLPTISLTGSGPAGRLRVEYLRRVSSPGTTYGVEFSTDPGTGWVPASAPETVTSINSQWQRVVVEDTAGSGGSNRFGRVKVTFTP